MATRVNVASGTADVQAVSGATELHGYSIRESALVAAAATVILRDGTDATGVPLVYIELAADRSETRRLASIDVATGVFVDRVAGETELTIFTS